MPLPAQKSCMTSQCFQNPVLLVASLPDGWISLYLLSVRPVTSRPSRHHAGNGFGLCAPWWNRNNTPPNKDWVSKGLSEVTSGNVWHVADTSQCMSVSFPPSCTPLLSHTTGFALSEHTRNFIPPILCFMLYPVTCVFPISHLSL